MYLARFAKKVHSLNHVFRAVAGGLEIKYGIYEKIGITEEIGKQLLFRAVPKRNPTVILSSPKEGGDLVKEYRTGGQKQKEKVKELFRQHQYSSVSETVNIVSLSASLAGAINGSHSQIGKGSKTVFVFDRPSEDKFLDPLKENMVEGIEGKIDAENTLEIITTHEHLFDFNLIAMVTCSHHTGHPLDYHDPGYYKVYKIVTKENSPFIDFLCQSDLFKKDVAPQPSLLPVKGIR